MAENHAASRSRDRSRTATVAAAFDEIVSAQVQRRRRMGSDAPKDPTTELLSVTVNGALLSDTDIVSILRNWTAGDLASMAAAVGVVVHFLAAHTEVQVALRAQPGNLAAAIDEMLRIDDPFLVSRRVTTTAVRVKGHLLESGKRIYLNWTSGTAMRPCSAIRTPTGQRKTQRIIWSMAPAFTFAQVVLWQRWNS